MAEQGSKQSQGAKGKEKPGKVEADAPRVTASGKPIASFEERQKRAEALTAKQKEGRGEEPLPKAQASQSSTSKGSKTAATGEPKNDTSKPLNDSGKDSGEKSTSQSKETATEKPKAETASGDDADPVKLKDKLDRAGAALEKGDLKEVAKLLGKGGKITDVGGEKFAVIARQRARLTKREQALDAREAKHERTATEHRNTFGDVVAMRTSYQQGQHHIAAKIWEKITGDSFATTTQKIARHTSGLSKEKLAELDERDRLERENRQLKAEKESNARVQTQHATRAQALTNLSKKLEGSEVLLLEDGSELVLREIERAWDRDQSRLLTPAEAAKRVLEREYERARKLGLSRAQAAAAAEEAQAEPVVATNRRPRTETAPGLDGTERRTLGGKLIPSFAQRQALAQRLTERRRGQ